MTVQDDITNFEELIINELDRMTQSIVPPAQGQQPASSPLTSVVQNRTSSPIQLPLPNEIQQMENYFYENGVLPRPIIVASGGIATQEALDDAADDPEGPRTPVLLPRSIRVPSPPLKRRRFN